MPERRMGEKGRSLSIALDPVRMLINSAAHLWQHLERHAAIEARPQRSGLDAWLSNAPTTSTLDAAEILQLRRDYSRLCSLLDQLETLLRDGPRALAIVRARVAEQLPETA